MNKNKMSFIEAGNGAEAVQAYRDSSLARFDAILMGKPRVSSDELESV